MAVIGTGGTYVGPGGIPAGGFAGATGVPGNAAGSFGGAASAAGSILPGISALAGLGSSVAGAISAYRSSKAARKYSKKQAKQAERAGRQNAATIAINRRKFAGAQRAAAAASGVVANSGSPLDLLIDNYILGIIDESRALSDASYRAQEISSRGEIEFQAGMFSAAQNATSGFATGAERNLFSIKGNPVVTAGQTLLGGLRN